MQLEKLYLSNFRNYEESEIVWHNGVNIIRGDNAQGKTNILEAIAFLSTFKSFRKNTVSEMIKKDKEYFIIKSCFKAAGGDHTLNVACSRDKRTRIKVDDVLKKRAASVVGMMNTVVFSPDDLIIMKGHPEDRRSFLDREIIQTEPEMYGVYNRYRKTLKQRNALLKESCFDEGTEYVLKSYNKQLAESGSMILKRREDMIKRLQPLIRLSHRHITGGNEELSLGYKGELLPNNSSDEDWQEFFMKGLENSFLKDRRAGFTTFGPHRDDISFYINGDEIRIFGSQGQQRTAALALKIGELELMKAHRGEYPLLLLDDVLSELDESRREALISVISGKIQTLVTDTGSEKLFPDAAEYRVVKGTIRSTI